MTFLFYFAQPHKEGNQMQGVFGGLWVDGGSMIVEGKVCFSGVNFHAMPTALRGIEGSFSLLRCFIPESREC